jgi:hypothetical protein
MKHVTAAACAIILTAFVAGAQEAPEITGGDDLVKKKSASWDELWVNPEADFASYHKLYAWEPVFEFRDVKAANATTIALSRGAEDAFRIRPEDQKKFEQIVTQTVLDELARSKRFELVDTVAPETLILRVSVRDIISRVPPNPTRSGNIYLTAVGEATVVFELIDAETGVIQARISDRRLIQPQNRMFEVNSLPANAATVWTDVERWAGDQARNLRKALDKAAKKASS